MVFQNQQEPQVSLHITFFGTLIHYQAAKTKHNHQKSHERFLYHLI